MKNFYLVTCDYSVWNKEKGEDTERESFTLGVFDTSERAISYIRKFYSEELEDGVYRQFSKREDTDGNVYAEVFERCSLSDNETQAVRLIMTPIQINTQCNPREDIKSHFVG